MTQLLLDSVLESLDLARAEPGQGLLEALFARFNARVPFETASKIERNASVSDPAAKPRRPEIFWADHLERGAGGTCFARVAAFEALLAALGFRPRKILGRVVEDFDHAALLVPAGERAWICDVGFPLPDLLPAGPGEFETPLAAVRVEASARGWKVELQGVPEGPGSLELFAAEVPEDEFERRWRSTFRPESKFLTGVALRWNRENRAISYARGSVRVDDRHSRLTVPLEPPRARRVGEIFGVDEDLLAAAFARVGDPGPDAADAMLVGYLETSCDADRAISSIADAVGYRRLLEGVAEVVSAEAAPGGWTMRLRAPGPETGEGLLEDRAALDLPERRLSLERRSASGGSVSFYQALERNGRTYLARGLRLSGPREDLLRNDSLRGRLAGSLAADLLGWSRLAGVGG